VVAITTEITVYGIFGPVTSQGAGTGWIIDPDGLIVTNNHVVDGASIVTVTLEDGRSFTAQELYADAFSDLAVIKIDAHNLPAAKIGGAKDAYMTTAAASTSVTTEMAAPSSYLSGSTSLCMGDWVVVLGNSLGMGISATKGIVSATGVSVTYNGNVLYNLIQTDAAINAGNSGGPVVNLAGEVVGISSAKVSSVGVEGMGYAISIEEAYPILQKLISDGYVSRPDIGANLRTVTKAFATANALAVNNGAFIIEVTRNGPADMAGLSRGDVIVAVEDIKVTSAESFKHILQSYEAGQQVQITYYRGTDKKTVIVTLVEAS
jgi:serine protease Do